MKRYLKMEMVYKKDIGTYIYVYMYWKKGRIYIVHSADGVGMSMRLWRFRLKSTALPPFHATLHSKSWLFSAAVSPEKPNDFPMRFSPSFLASIYTRLASHFVIKLLGYSFFCSFTSILILYLMHFATATPTSIMPPLIASDKFVAALTHQRNIFWLLIYGLQPPEIPFWIAEHILQISKLQRNPMPMPNKRYN